MELEDLKRQWQADDRKLDIALRLNARLLTGPVLNKAEVATKRLSRWLWVELLINLAFALSLGSFISDHAGQARFLLPAAGVDLFVIGLMIAGIRQIVSLGSLDYGAPIVQVQRRLESLRIERIRAAKLTLLLAPLLWTPLLIVTLRGVFGLDAYSIFPAGWLAANFLLGVAIIPAAIWLSRRYAERAGRSPLLRSLMRDLAGHSLNAATRFLGSLAQFETEENGEQKAGSSPTAVG